MKNSLKPFLQRGDHLYINAKHQIQIMKYGVYNPPTRKQLISLRYLVESLEIVKEVNPSTLLGFSRVECNAYLKRLNQLYETKCNNTLKEDLNV